MIETARRLLVAGIAFAAAVPVLAQDGRPQGVPHEFRSPRDVMEHYLGGAVPVSKGVGTQADVDRAVSCFDLSGFAAFEREARGERLAQDLIYILDRVEIVAAEELPGEGDPQLESGEYSRTWLRSEGPEASMRVTFVRVDDGRWLIGGETLDAIGRKIKEVRGLPTVVGIEDKTRTLTEILRTRVIPKRLQTGGFLLEHWQWIGLLVLLFLAVVLDRVARGVVAVLARRVTRGTAGLDEEELANFARPAGIFAGAWTFQAFLYLLDLDPGAQSILALAASFVLTVAGVWAALRLVDLFCGYLARRAAATDNKFDDMLVPLLRRTLKFFVVAIGLVYIASKWTEDLWGIVAGIGIGSIAVGFAARDSIENLFGTFTVLLDKPFQIGDWIIVGDLEGTVEEVGFRSTRLRTFYNSLITVPNRTFISSDVDNMGKRRYRRIKTMLSLTYDTPPEKIEAFCEGVRRIVATHPYTRKDYYHVYFNGFGASSLEVLLYCFVETPDWSTELREKHRLFADVLRLAERLGVSFAFPTQTLHVAKPEDLEHPDRPASDAEGASAGRRAADEIVEKTLEPYGGPGSRPPPVVVGRDPRLDRGSVDDGDGG